MDLHVLVVGITTSRRSFILGILTFTVHHPPHHIPDHYYTNDHQPNITNLRGSYDEGKMLIVDSSRSSRGCILGTLARDGTWTSKVASHAPFNNLWDAGIPALPATLILQGHHSVASAGGEDDDSTTSISPALAVFRPCIRPGESGMLAAVSEMPTNGTVTSASSPASGLPTRGFRMSSQNHDGSAGLASQHQNVQSFLPQQGQACEVGRPYLTVRGSISILFHFKNVALQEEGQRTWKEWEKTRQVGNACKFSDMLPTRRFSGNHLGIIAEELKTAVTWKMLHNLLIIRGLFENPHKYARACSPLDPPV
ncbi:hypothetical protein BKA65DRAFT_472525 [Rhexocercosporidium sp. MPI-PUGE-AT-0058]|nr:hypothetical protein BKA65DRAFT_472525 [Rhexocercosporidium sp. MPI-PUGE-AT-0058]